MNGTLYIFSKGKLKRRNNTLYFQGEEESSFFPIEEVKEIFLFGSVEINKKLVKLLSNYHIFLHIFDYYENYVGSFYPKEFNNSGKVLLSQIKYYNDKKMRKDLAFRIIRGAIENILSILRYYYKRGIEVKNEGKRIKKYKNEIDKSWKIEKLMSAEGKCRKIYYKALNKIINYDYFTFDKRTRQPPKDPINALISFGNVILYSKILQIIHETHLDPRIGYLHETNFRKFSLNLDLAEIFKPIVVDRLIFTLINRNQLGEENFKEKKGGIYLTKPGIKIFMKELENKLGSTIKLRGKEKKISYRNLIRDEIYKIERHVTDKKKYKPYISRW